MVYIPPEQEIQCAVLFFASGLLKEAHQFFQGNQAAQALDTCDHVVLQEETAQIGKFGEPQCFNACQLVVPEQQDLKVGQGHVRLHRINVPIGCISTCNFHKPVSRTTGASLTSSTQCSQVPLAICRTKLAQICATTTPLTASRHLHKQSDVGLEHTSQTHVSLPLNLERGHWRLADALRRSVLQRCSCCSSGTR